LLAGDIAVLYLSLFVAVVIRLWALPTYETVALHFMPFTVLFALWIVVFYVGDLYENAISKNEVKFYNLLLKILWLNCGITAAYFYFASRLFFNIQPQVLFIIFGLTSCVLTTTWRYAYNAFVLQPKMQRNVLVIGLNEGALELISEINRNPQLGYRIPAVVYNSSFRDFDLQGVAIYDESVNIKRLLIEKNIGTIVTALDPRSNSSLVQQLFECLSLKVQFFELANFYERLTGKIPVNNIGHLWFLENLASSDKSFYEFVKRFIDIVVAAALLLIALPFIPLIVLAIRLDSKGPAFFFQKRTGLLGKPFRAIKFRTMYLEAESDGLPRWAQKKDPRVTRVGRFLRKARIDELPQLWNVIKGEMSVIGPRPERPEFIRQLERDIPFYNERHLVHPGVTGWAQIRFNYTASVSDSLKKLEYDFFYIKNRSLALDMAILLKTISIVLTGKGQ
jgi:exopolysaccharide biosynthesis polyprenyl glycosylphosphotransferase